MKDVKVLDCTLRDGGCVNDFNFGTVYMQQILFGIEQSGAEIIECGYIDENMGSAEGRTQYLNEHVIETALVKEKKPGKLYVAMIDCGKYDVTKLGERTSSSIDGIRLAFHKKNVDEIISLGKIIIEKGYDLFIQPMLVMRYSDRELLDLIETVNRELPTARAFYMVDSFGEMRETDIDRLTALIDHNLNKNIAFGFHSHNNLQLSYSNAVSLLKYPTDREIIIDVSILGMGKGAGNLNAELFEEHLNIFHGKKYNISPLLNVIDKVLNQIREEYHWGYSVEYYLSSINHCTPSYAGFFYEKHTLSIEEISILLGKIEEEKKISFDREYAKQMYYAFMKKRIDDTAAIAELTDKCVGKKILLVAPGKSICQKEDKILHYIETEKPIVIAVNHTWNKSEDFVFCTKNSSYDVSIKERKRIIATSNVDIVDYDNQLIVNYSDHNSFDGNETDISGIILINLLIKLGAKNVALAGFDGFSVDINNNYYDKLLQRPVNSSVMLERNQKLRDYLKCISNKVNILFLTNSVYIEDGKKE